MIIRDVKGLERMERQRERVIFWGAGIYAENAWKQINDAPFFTDNYIAMVDKNEKLWKQNFYSLKIISPGELNQYAADLIVITSIYINEIKRQLVDELGFPENKIYTFDEYRRKCFTKWQYIEKYGFLGGENCCFDMKKMVIYTAITGDYDNLKEPLIKQPDITYVCFTNNRKLKSDVWNIEYINDNSLDDLYLSKKIKMFPHLYLQEYETSIWVDGSLRICEDLKKYVRQFGKEKPVLCFPHSERDCIYDEAGVCLAAKIGNKREIIRQISAYYEMGYPVNNGLYEMGCIVRQHNNEKVKRIMGKWWEEITEYSYRDQISFPVVCWKEKFSPDICGLICYKNRWLMVYPHNKNRKISL